MNREKREQIAQELKAARDKAAAEKKQSGSASRRMEAIEERLRAIEKALNLDIGPNQD